jgi:hypothetical protein
MQKVKIYWQIKLPAVFMHVWPEAHGLTGPAHSLMSASHLSPVKPVGQEHVLPSTQVPPFWQEGVH